MELTSENLKQILIDLSTGAKELKDLPSEVWENKPFVLTLLKIYREKCIRLYYEKPHLVLLGFFSDATLVAEVLHIDEGFHFIKDHVALVPTEVWCSPEVLNSLAARPGFMPETIFEFLPHDLEEEYAIALISLFRNTKNVQNLDVCFRKLKNCVGEVAIKKGNLRFIKTKFELEMWLTLAGSESLDFVAEELIGRQKVFMEILNYTSKDKKKPRYIENVIDYAEKFEGDQEVYENIVKTGLETIFTERDIKAAEKFGRFALSITKEELSNTDLIMRLLDANPTHNMEIIFNRILESFIKNDCGNILMRPMLLEKLRKKMEKGGLNFMLWKDPAVAHKLKYILSLSNTKGR